MKNHDETTLVFQEMADATDPYLIDIYQEGGLISEDTDLSYTTADVLRIARAAFWAGVEEHSRDRQGKLGALLRRWALSLADL